MERAPILVCFAVKEEAKFLQGALKSDPWQIVITGMGKKNAAESVRKAIADIKPRLVITSGFAGGLNPNLKWGSVVFDEDAEAGLTPQLLKRHAIAVRFHCADHVAVTAAEKQELWKSTGADAIEMESSAIREICREHNIPSATIRVISDAAATDLPLDFNALMTRDYKMNYPKLAWTLMRQPAKIRQLMLFQANISFVAKDLAFTLLSVLGE
jgi:nucleoside phosphorylase